MSYAEIAAAYAGLRWHERLYARIRYATAPLARVAALVPPEAKSVVEIGCAAGVFANVLKARRADIDITGVDADRAKVATAQKTCRGRGGISFVSGDAFAYLESHGPFDAIICVDVLYLFPPRRQDELIRLAAERLPRGGYLIIKEMTDRPRWKKRWCAFQERLAVRVLGFTKGGGVYLRAGEEYRRAMTAAALAVETFDLSRGYLHPHFALRGKKGRDYARD